MELILEGIVLGLTLAIMLGPIFITITQAALERGLTGGLSVGMGIWVSDISIVTLCYLFINRLSFLVKDESFTFWMGLVGGLILIAFGIGTFLRKENILQSGEEQPIMESEDTRDSVMSAARSNRSQFLTISKYVTKGFLVNTINPFTFIFWIGVVSTYVIGRNISFQESMVFFGTILFMIILTDILKVFLAKMLRTRLNPAHILAIGKGAGVILALFGVLLLLKSKII